MYLLTKCKSVLEECITDLEDLVEGRELRQIVFAVTRVSLDALVVSLRMLDLPHFCNKAHNSSITDLNTTPEMSCSAEDNP